VVCGRREHRANPRDVSVPTQHQGHTRRGRGIDIERPAVGLRAARQTLGTRFDGLIVATGSAQSHFGRDEFASTPPGLKTIEDALEVRGRIFGAFEMAEPKKGRGSQPAKRVGSDCVGRSPADH
jgi:NADH:ubiquinone reductase (H+-translocating)